MRYVALLRGINVGGNTTIIMAEMKGDKKLRARSRTSRITSPPSPRIPIWSSRTTTRSPSTGHRYHDHRSTLQGVRNIQFRSSHVWMKRDGKWLIVAHHASQITPEVE